MAGGINVGRWLRKVTGKPVTVGSVAALLATIRADTVVKESFEARVKHELLLGLDLERVLALLDKHEAELVEALPGGVIAIRIALEDIRDWVRRAQAAVTDWQL